MTAEDAKRLVMEKFPSRDVMNVTENEMYFLVSTLPKRSKELNNSVIIRPIPLDDGLKAVSKETKEVFTYNPIRHGE